MATGWSLLGEWGNSRRFEDVMAERIDRARGVVKYFV
jgi:hypothetical protein